MKRFGMLVFCLALSFVLLATACSGLNAVSALADGEELEVMIEDATGGVDGIAMDGDGSEDDGLTIEDIEAEDPGLALDFDLSDLDAIEMSTDTDEEGEAGAEGNAEANVSSDLTYNICDFGAVPDDGEDDRAAINAALAMALEANGEITVIIPAGKYLVSDGLFVYSDTNIRADADATIVSKKKNGSVVYGAHLDETTGERCKGVMLGGDYCKDHGFGYSKTQNVTIEGGTWECLTGKGVMTTNVFAFRHSKNITIKNLTCKYASGHMVNLSGTDTATVSGVTFLDAKKSNEATNYWNEAIHLDYCNEEGEPTSGTPYDNTPSKNITVENCTFDHVHAGVGNHHVRPKNSEISSNIKVLNCTFSNIDAFAVDNRSVNGMKILDNTANNVGVFAYITDSTNVTIRGNTFNAVGSHKYDKISGDGNLDRAAIEIRTTKEAKEVNKNYAVINKVTVANNTILNSVYGGISVYGYLDEDPDKVSIKDLENCKSVTVSNNTVKKSKGVGIDVQNTSGTIVKKNKVISAKDNGIFVQTSKGAEVSGNNVTSDGKALYIMGLEKVPCTVRILDNVLNSKNAEDLFLSNYAKNCYLSGNTLKNYAFMMASTASYTGTIDLPKLDKATLKKKVYAYTGKMICPKPTVTDTVGRVLKLDTDYKLAYSNCTNVSNNRAVVRVIGIGSVFKGQEISVNFSILKECTPKVILSKTSYVYSGVARKPGVTVKAGNETLRSTQYTVTYPIGRINVGTYTVKVELKNGYIGSGSASFKITKAPNSMKITDKALTQTISKNEKQATVIDIKKCFTVSNAAGTVTYKKTAGSNYVTVDSKTGKLTVQKGTPRSTQTVKIQVTAAGNNNYLAKSITKVVKVVVE